MSNIVLKSFIKLSVATVLCTAFVLTCYPAEAKDIEMAQVDLGGLPSDPFADSQDTGYIANPQTQQVAPVQQPLQEEQPQQPQSQWTGTSTSWGGPQGQELIAPEVNVDNMLTMTQQLRDLGYVIPPKMDNMIANSPESMRYKIMTALHNIKNGGRGSVAAKTVATIMRDLEKETGMSFENVLGTTFDILSGKKKESADTQKGLSY